MNEHERHVLQEAEANPVPERFVEGRNVFVAALPHPGGADVKATIFIARGSERQLSVAAADERTWIARHMPHVARMVAAAEGAKERKR